MLVLYFFLFVVKDRFSEESQIENAYKSFDNHQAEEEDALSDPWELQEKEKQAFNTIRKSLRKIRK